MKEPELGEVGHYLYEEGLINYFTFGHINITHKGRKEAERLMEESYSQKKRRVLEAIADMSRMSRVVLYPALAQRLDMSDRELAVLCNGLDEQGFIDFPGGDIIQMRNAGYEALEPKPQTSPTNIVHIHNNYAPVAQGSHFTQNVTQIVNEFESAIHNLQKAVEDSKELSTVQKMTLRNDIDMVQQLAQIEKTPEVIETASSKIEFINSVVSSTADMVSLGLVVIPIIKAFFGL